MTDRRGVIRRRAEDLLPGVAYVRGWSHAHSSAGALADRLKALGLDADFPGLKADVNVDGDGLVCLGAVRPEAAQLLAQALMTALALDIADQAARPGIRPAHLPTSPDKTPRRTA
ncbi:hypothetical protein ACFYT4_01330 [Streptomyces sp. NPDC004609]|uniref:hypothetical protein n=1 Tax=Streptomyces sp. NPDC004609 TaxID=3364704 RepID=UPI0036A88057